MLVSALAIEILTMLDSALMNEIYSIISECNGQRLTMLVSALMNEIL